VKRVVTEASRLKVQADFLQSLRSTAVEIAPDTRIAELSEPGSHVESAQWLRCVDNNRPMTPRDFDTDGIWRIASEVAALAIENKVDAVLAPSHFIKDAQSSWWHIDLELCTNLRRALDQLGGKHIRNDYCLITSYRTLLNLLENLAQATGRGLSRSLALRELSNRDGAESGESSVS